MKKINCLVIYCLLMHIPIFSMSDYDSEWEKMQFVMGSKLQKTNGLY